MSGRPKWSGKSRRSSEYGTPILQPNRCLHFDLKAGVYMAASPCQRCRLTERNLSIMLLIDVSGSTGGWISSHRRITDVEREALLLVCIALKEMLRTAPRTTPVQMFPLWGPEKSR